LWAALKNDRHNGDLIELLPKSQIIDSELPGDFTIEIKYYGKYKLASSEFSLFLFYFYLFKIKHFAYYLSQKTNMTRG